jgi:hypothetical protein
MDFGSVAEYFADTAALAGLVLIVVAFLRAHVLTNLHGWAVIALSLVIGAVLGAAGHFLAFLDGGLTAALMFGVTAGFAASGGFDAVRALLGKASPS